MVIASGGHIVNSRKRSTLVGDNLKEVQPAV